MREATAISRSSKTFPVVAQKALDGLGCILGPPSHTADDVRQ